MIAPPVCYFPYTNITPTSLAGAMAFFNRIILYRLPNGQFGPEAGLAEAGGRLDLRRLSFYEDESELASVLAGLNQMALTYRDPESLAWLRSRRDELEDSGARLMSTIKGHREAPRDPGKEAQVFLHLAQDLDARQAEIDGLVSGMGEREKALGDILGIDDAPVVTDLEAPGFNLTGGLLPKRLAAWARFFLEFGSSGELLFTDDREAISLLDTNAAKTLDGKMDPDREWEALEPLFSLKTPNPAPPDAWNTLNEFIDRVAQKSWVNGELEKLRREASEITSAITQSEEPGPSVTAYLLPGADLKQAFTSAAGLPVEGLGKDVYCGLLFLLKQY